MPELPEVETICRQLQDCLVGKRIEDYNVYLDKSFRALTDRSPLLRGATVTGIRRRGKYILIETDADLVLLIHLRMTGSLIYASAPEPRTHLRVRFYLADGGVLDFKDIRTFGQVLVLEEDECDGNSSLAKLGVEPLSEAWSGDYLYALTRKRTLAIKALLLDQRGVAGIGNIYADEALFRAGIRPQTHAGKLTKPKARRLAEAIRTVLQESIGRGGTSFRDYRDSAGKKGRNAAYLQVYGRGGEPCLQCGTILKKIQIGGRTSVYCPHCQK